MALENLKIAIVCDWLTVQGGAERVITAMHELFPHAPIFTTLYDSAKLPQFKNADVRTSWLQRLPVLRKKHQLLLPWMPSVFESMNLDEYDIVISSSHSCAKGIITKPETLHICYCHTPMRYCWDNYHQYLKEYPLSALAKKIGQKLLHKIRIWDRMAAERVDSWLTNSNYVQQRITKYYRKLAHVIYPPVELDRFYPIEHKKLYFLALGRLTPYKRFDILVEAFNALELPLIIIGTGIEEKRLRRRAKKNIRILGHLPESEIPTYLSEAQAVLFPQVEDFGIVPIEAMASGTPVIAYKEGGALETVKEGVNGIFFDHQTPMAIMQAVRNFQQIRNTFDPEKLRAFAMNFSKENFQKRLLIFVENEWIKWKTTPQ